MKKTIIFVILGLVLAGLGIKFASVHNEERTLRNTFTAKMDERVAFYERMFDIISKKVQVTKANKDAFKENVQIIMEGRKDSEQVFFKWVTETNPNAEYKEVAALYKDVSRAIESERIQFFEQEKVLQDIKRQHDNLLDLFPNNIFLAIMGREKFDYQPIQSTQTKQVFETGLDDNKDLGF